MFRTNSLISLVASGQYDRTVYWAAGEGANTQSVDGLLKDVFEDFIAEAVQQKCPLKDVFKLKKGKFPGGRGLTFTAHVGRNAGTGFAGEDTAFPAARNQKHKQGQIDQRKLMGRVRLTWEAMNDTSVSEAAFKDAKGDEMAGLIKDLARKEEYALATTGKGIYARANGAITTTTVELKDPGGLTNASFGNRFIIPGMYIMALDPATNAPRTLSVEVLDTNEDGTDVTVDAAPTWTSGDNIVQAASGSTTSILDTSYERAFWGLPALVDDGTFRNDYFGIPRDQFRNYKSYVIASVGALSLDVMQRIADVVDQKLGGVIDLILAHHSTRRLYIQLLASDRRYSGNNLQNPDGGTAAMKQGDLTVGGINVKAIRDLALDQMYFLDTANSGFMQYVSEPGKWEDGDDRVMVRDGTGTGARHAYEAWYFMRKQNFCRYPAYNGRLDGITGQTLVVVRAE